MLRVYLQTRVRKKFESKFYTLQIPKTEAGNQTIISLKHNQIITCKNKSNQIIINSNVLDEKLF